MSLFELSIPVILRREGGFVNDATDPGGATNYGVSLRWLRSQGLAGDINHDGDIDIADIKALTPAEAEGFYRTRWWDAYQYGQINAQALATKVFDMAVNLGPPRAHRMAQQAIGLPQDGILGSKSFTELNTLSSLTIIMRLQDIQAKFYRQLVAVNPARQKYLAGWLNRAYDRS
jgi:lysozyme family protein